MLYSITDNKYTIVDKYEGLEMEFFLCVMGMVMIIEGLPWFAFPDKMKQVVITMIGQPEQLLRRFGFLMMIAGLGIIYLGKS